MPEAPANTWFKVNTSKRPVNEAGRVCDWKEAAPAGPDHKPQATSPGRHACIVFDIDHDLEDARGELQRLFGPPLVAVPSMSGAGEHWWYRAAAPLKGGPWLYGDVRCQGGYVVVTDRAAVEAALADPQRACHAVTLEDTARIPRAPKAAPGRSYLRYIDPAALPYEEWLTVGMGLHAHTHGSDKGLEAWDRWSQRDKARYKAGECRRKWQGFDAKGGIGLGTVLRMARAGGWNGDGKEAEDKAQLRPDKVTRFNTDPPTWTLTFGEVVIRCDTRTLLSPHLFVRRWYDIAVTPWAGPRSHKAWARWIDKVIQPMTEQEEAPPDASVPALVMQQLEQFCTDAHALDREELLNGMPWEEGGFVWFRSGDFLQYLEKQKVRGVTPQSIAHIIREASGSLVNKLLSVKGKKLRVWGIAAFTRQTEEFSVPPFEQDY